MVLFFSVAISESVCKNRSCSVAGSSDMMRPALRQEDFDTEKQVILEEIAKYDDQPPYGAHEKCMAAHFGPHPLGRSVLGTGKSVGDLKRDQMLEYFERRYSPKNIVLAAGGNVDFARLVEEAQKSCGTWKPFEAPRVAPRAKPNPGFVLLHKPLAVQEYVIQIAAGPCAEDDDRYAARLLATILGDDTGSRFFWELIDTGLAESASIGVSEFQGSGIYMTGLSCEPDEAAGNLQLIRELLEVAQASGVTERASSRPRWSASWASTTPVVRSCRAIRGRPGARTTPTTVIVRGRPLPMTRCRC